MFIAHAPAGYLIGASLAARIRDLPMPARTAILIAIAGSLAPDLDLLYFYLVDNRHTPHHKYISHWPIMWGPVFATSLLWCLVRRQSKAAFSLALFAFCALVHLVMDTLVGDIWWLAPFVDRPYALFRVEARFKPWWLNFIFHWSFIAELLLSAWAIVLYRYRSKRSDGGSRDHTRPASS